MYPSRPMLPSVVIVSLKCHDKGMSFVLNTLPSQQHHVTLVLNTLLQYSLTLIKLIDLLFTPSA